MVALVSTVAYLGLEARAVEVQCQVAAGHAALHRRRPARQGGRREPRAGPGRARRDGPVAAAQADHHQPLARRPAQGRQPLRPADRARAARGDGRDRRRAARPTISRSASWRSTAASSPSPGVLLAALHASERGEGADLPGRARRRGALGERGAGDRRARPRQPAQPPQGRADACPSRRRARSRRRGRARTSSRSRARRPPSARSRSPRRAGTTC